MKTSTPNTFHAPTAIRVGANLRQLREARGLSLEEVGRAANVSAIWLSHMEGGGMAPTVQDLYPLAKFFGTTIGHLLGAVTKAVPGAVVKCTKRGAK